MTRRKRHLLSFGLRREHFGFEPSKADGPSNSRAENGEYPVEKPEAPEEVDAEAEEGGEGEDEDEWTTESEHEDEFQQYGKYLASDGHIDPFPVSHMASGDTASDEEAPRGRKKALLCACCYKGMPMQLSGCISDAKAVKAILVKHFGYRKQDIRMLLDDELVEEDRPTYDNIVKESELLVADAEADDRFFFYFSGHGTSLADENHEERDGFNEALCPTPTFFQEDGEWYVSETSLVDNLINKLLVRPLPEGAILHGLVDACHSGSVFDLEWRTKCKRGRCGDWEEEYDDEPEESKKTSGGRAVLFAASKDNQCSTEGLCVGLHDDPLRNYSRGHATAAFCHALEEQGPGISYGELLKQIHERVDDMDKAVRRLISEQDGTPFKKAHPGVKLGQTPVLSSSDPFDLDEELAI